MTRAAVNVCGRGVRLSPASRTLQHSCASPSLIGARRRRLQPASGNVEIAGITADSRDVRPGFLFAALAGRQGGRRALHRRCGRQGRRRRPRRGRTPRSPAPATCPVLRADEPRRALALMAARFYGRAARRPRSPSPAPAARPRSPSSPARSSPRWGAAGRLARHHRPGQARRRRLRLADDARSGDAARDAGRAGRARASRIWRSRPPRTASTSTASTACSSTAGGLHQSRPRPPRLSPDGRGLPSRQAAAVHRAAAAGTARPWSTPMATERRACRRGGARRAGST